MRGTWRMDPHSTAMQKPLDYQTPPRYDPPLFGEPKSPWLGILPVAATGVTLTLALWNAETEPFGVFEPWDAAVHVGSLVVVALLWAWWAVRAYMERLSPLAVLPLVLWAAILLFLNTWLAVGYFYEPWNP